MHIARSKLWHFAPNEAREILPTLACSALKQVLSLVGLRRRLSILIYHRVLPQPDPLFPDEIDAAGFDRQLAYLCECFTMISLSQAVHGLRTGTLPPRAACITFDDGYADNAAIVLPILQRHEVTATFFIASDFLDGGRMWNDTVIELIRAAPPALDLRALGCGEFILENDQQRHAAIATVLNALKYLPLEQRQVKVDRMCAQIPVPLRTDLMMTSDQVRTLHSAGMEIGGHTVNHPILACLEPAQARNEIAAGKEALEAITGSPVRFFAYPNGQPGLDYLGAHVSMVKQLGFDAAVSTSPGAAGANSDLFQLPRFTPWEMGRVRFTLSMIRNLQRRGHTVRDITGPFPDSGTLDQEKL